MKKDISQGIEIRKRPEDERVAISEQGIRIRHEGKPISHEGPTIGLVYLVVDCSVSMGEGNKLSQAKRGTINFAKEARNKGYLTGLIKFESSATHLCEPLRDVSVLEKEVERINIGGSTNMADAIHIATERLKTKKGLPVIVITTDGMPDSREKALYEAERAKKVGIDIITVGTDDADKDFLRKLASRTNLGVKVSREQFGKGISSVTKMLPQLERGKREG